MEITYENKFRSVKHVEVYFVAQDIFNLSKYSRNILIKYVLCYSLLGCSINVKQMLLIDGVVQLFDIFLIFLSVSFIKWCFEMSAKIVHFYVLFLFTPSAFMYFSALLFHICTLRITDFLKNWPFYQYEICIKNHDLMIHLPLCNNPLYYLM